MHHRARLHRANLLAALPEIPRRTLKQDKADEAELDGKKYTYILDKPYRWETWAAPKGKDGKLDHNKALTGDDLRDFVNGKLFPYLHGFKQKASGPNTIEYKIGEIFGEIKNKIQSGYNLREIIDHIDELRFRSQNREARALAPLRSQDQEHGQRRAQRRRVLHSAPAHPRHCSGGEAQDRRAHLRRRRRLGGLPLRIVRVPAGQESRPHHEGREDPSGAHLLRQGEEVARLRHRHHEHDPAWHRGAQHHPHQHPHRKPRRHSGERPRTTWCMANPPFGGKERKEVQQNFPIRTGETAFLFLQHFIKMLKAGGRGGVVIKNTFLSNTDNASVSLRKLLLGKLQPPHRARLPRRHLPGRGREDRGALLRERRAHAQSLVLPARSRPQSRQDQPAQRRRPRRVREAAKDLRRLAQELERGRQEHRPRRPSTSP